MKWHIVGMIVCVCLISWIGYTLMGVFALKLGGIGLLAGAIGFLCAEYENNK